MQNTEQRWPRMHASRCCKPFVIYLVSEGITNSFESRNKFVFKTGILIQRMKGVQVQDEKVEDCSVVLSLDIRKGCHCDIEPRILEVAENILSHLGLVLPITQWTRVFNSLAARWLA